MVWVSKPGAEERGEGAEFDKALNSLMPPWEDMEYSDGGSQNIIDFVVQHNQFWGAEGEVALLVTLMINGMRERDDRFVYEGGLETICELLNINYAAMVKGYERNKFGPLKRRKR